MISLGRYAETFDRAGINRKTARKYIERFSGSTFVVTGGDWLIGNGYTIAPDLALMHHFGKRVIFVNGREGVIGQRLGEMGIESEFAGGYRVTKPGMMKPIEGALDKANYTLCREIEASGVDVTSMKSLTYARKHKPIEGRRLWYVGRPTRLSMDREKLMSMADRSVLVVSPICFADNEYNGKPHDADWIAREMRKKRLLYNAKALDVADVIARELEAERLFLLDDRNGVVIDGSTVPELRTADAEGYIDSGEINTEMAPQVRRAIRARMGGVGAVGIINGRTRHALLKETYGSDTVGTMIV